MASALLALYACGGSESGSTDPGPAPSFTLGGTISGLSGTVALQNNGGDNLTISANGGFTFTTALTDTSPYAVTVLTQPAGQTCTVANGAGTIAGANVTNVIVTCAADTFTVGGTVSGLSGSVVLRNNGSNDLTVSANGSFTFSAPVAQGSPYAVTVFAQPAGQTCSVTNGTGTVGGANVTSARVICVVNTFTVGGTVSGLTGSVVLRNSGNDLTVSANGNVTNFTFSAPVAQGNPYAVTVLTQPASQTCTVANGAGTIVGANVTNVNVTCAVNTFTVGGTVSGLGLTGTVVLQNNAGNDLTRSVNGPFTFSAPVAQGSTYAVTVLTQPANQICSVINATGAVGGANVTTVTVTCVNTFTVGGTVSGLVGTVVLQNNSGDNLARSANGPFTFSARVAQGSTYLVTVLTPPAGRTCTVAKGAGTMAGANVTNVTVSCSTVSVTPKLGGLTTSQTQVITAAVDSAGVIWTTTGGLLTNQTATSATFSSTAAGSFTITATGVTDNAQSASATIGVTDLAGVFTQRNDAQRTGQNRREFALTSDTVTGATFGRLFSCPVDGEVYAQPLYVANLVIAVGPQAGTHNVVLVATQNDSVYAFDADASSCVPIWQKSFLRTGVTTVPPADTSETGDINTIIGITGTPVIDPATGTLYVVAKTKETVGTGCSVVAPCYFQRLHALDLATGDEKITFGGPADISSAITVPGIGDTGEATCPGTAGNVPFCPLRENQRPGLLLQNGKVYVTWGSHGDQLPYHGWVIGYDASNLALPPVLFNTTPNGHAGGIWMSGMGPAADTLGNIYAITGNGTFDDTAAPRTNYGDSFIKLNPGLSQVLDFFTPFNQNDLSGRDFDVGAGGALVLPESVGSGLHPRLLIGGDKQGILYLIDRDAMTGFNASGDVIVQEVTVTASPCVGVLCGIFSTPAFWEGKLYLVAVGAFLKQYTIANASLTPVLEAKDEFRFPGATPAISSTEATNGIVWALNTSNNGTPNGSTISAPAILFAYDATNLNKLFTSPASGPGAAGNAVKFTVPTVANGKVYVGTQNELSVFGLLPN